MALTQRLDLRHSQSLVMTPQLQQAIKLLQLSNLELTAYVEQELEQNPLLQRDDGAVDGDSATDAESPGASDTPQSGGAEDLGTHELASSGGVTSPTDPPLDTDYDNLWNGASDGAAGPQLSASGPGAGASGSRGFSDGDRNFEQTLRDEISLRDHLIAQISVDLGNPVERMIGTFLVDTLDDSGYLSADLSEVATQLGCDGETLDAVIAKLQRLDPTGIFARGAAECLALQLREKDRLDPAMQGLLDNLDLLAKREFEELKRICGIDGEDLSDMIAEIQELDPKPAQRFDAVVAQPITPDILMRRQAGGGWLVELNNDTLPRVLVDSQYYAQVNKAARKKEEHEYLAERMQSANWLVKSLHQRATTILRVSAEIVRQQDDFFERGVQHLRPLVLRDIAGVLDMHESTVSRVTTNKYMSTPRGIFELKYFFTAAIAATGGGTQHSAEAVRHRIKALIDAEAPEAVLSDDAIVAALREDGVDIARRTVAKYRDTMRIPSSVQRRREKKRQKI